MKHKAFFFTSLFLILSSQINAQERAQEKFKKPVSSQMVIKSLVMNASAVGGASAYAASERASCSFSKASRVPKCINSIFGLLQTELSLQGLYNSRDVAANLLGEDSPNVQIDLKAYGFCLDPLKDSCTQDAVDKGVVDLYLPLKSGTGESYDMAIKSFQKRIDEKLSEFERNGYMIDKVARRVTPPRGAPQSFSGGTAVSARLFNLADVKFSKILKNGHRINIRKTSGNVKDVRRNEKSPIKVEPLLKMVKTLYRSGMMSKSYASKATDRSFLTGLTDEQKSVATVAPQGEALFSSISDRYRKRQELGEFIQP